MYSLYLVILLIISILYCTAPQNRVTWFGALYICIVILHYNINLRAAELMGSSFSTTGNSKYIFKMC